MILPGVIFYVGCTIFFDQEFMGLCPAHDPQTIFFGQPPCAIVPGPLCYIPWFSCGDHVWTTISTTPHFGGQTHLKTEGLLFRGVLKPDIGHLIIGNPEGLSQ